MTKDEFQDKLTRDLLSRFFTKDVDLHGRRIINAGPSKDAGDYVTRSELDLLKARIEALEKQTGA